jgi:hypothetical protein
MHWEKNMAEKVQLTLSGETQRLDGRVSGKGSITLMADASTVCFALDYRSKDRIVLTLSGEQGIRLSASDTLTFSGSVSRDLADRHWQGEYALKLEISQSVAATLSQKFTRQGTKTYAEITIHF